MALLWIHQVEPDAALLGKALGGVILATLVMFFVRLYQARMSFRRAMKKYDIPMLPHSFLFGHLIPVGKALAPFPRDFSKLSVPIALHKAYPEMCAHGVIYFDTWPFGGATFCIFHPDIACQFTQDNSLPKAAEISRELQPFTDLHDLISMEGMEWKFWRSVFNPSFSAKNLTALLPAFLEEIQVLKERFIQAAHSGEILNMEKTVSTATVDVICRAALGIRLHSQTRSSSFVTALQNQIWWLVCDYSLANRLKEAFPLRPFFTWNNNRKMRNFLAPLIEEGIAAFDNGEVMGAKTINYLAVKAYRSEIQQQQQQQQPPPPPPEKSVVAKDGHKHVDPKFMDIAISQLKAFIFAGHDTTASTLSFIYSQLSQAPTILAKTRAEHDAVLGSDPTQALARLTEDPNLLNQMPYTHAVLKEVLRLYPPGATARKGAPDILLTHPVTGQQYPTDGFLVWSASSLTHRHPDYWERPDEFLPERFLAKEGEPLYPRKNAFRPFELGPRNCIGQELAQLELRAILAMTLRELEFEPAYEEDAPQALGEKAYQVMGFGDITGHVKGGFPVRVKLRDVKA
ncbi:hypothetical protein N0V93_003617 [Gnomoniopsis smithogilvyi]|uniref:Cytochrome P450 n=1 Tax=Gnomoniopsis smithogilvyi TaxID=1191159 RepID=A0A9W8Z140_9PEZI|nr:hypothetical protein N0V93_003617 [Gnomoniopsis smithogilvyi]